MALLSLKTENNIIVENFLLMLEDNLKKDSFIKNPFSNSRVHYTKREGTIFAVLDINSIWPDFTIYLLVLLGINVLLYISFMTRLFMITTIIVSVITIITNFMNSDKFYKIVLEKGLRKKGYNSYINYISTKDLCRNFVFGETNGPNRSV